MGKDLMAFLGLASGMSPFDVVREADTILAVGFDSTYGFAPIGINVKRAAKRGAALIAVNEHESNLDVLAEEAFQADILKWPAILDKFSGKAPHSGKRTASPDKVVILGEEAIFSPQRGAVFEKIIKMRDDSGWKVIVAHPYTNLYGLLTFGALSGLRRGEILRGESERRTVTLKDPWSLTDLKRRRKVVYLIGEAASDDLPSCDFLIYQNGLAASSSRAPDLVLPSSFFTERPGTIVNGEGVVLPVRKATAPYGESKPDWWIMDRISRKMKKGVLQYKSISQIQGDIKKQIKGFFDMGKRLEFSKIGVEKQKKGARVSGANVSRKPWQEIYRGIPLREIVPGMRVIEERRRHEQGN